MVGVAGWPVTVGVVEVGVGVSASREQTLSGTGARVYTALRGWLRVVTGISAASTGGVLVAVNHRPAFMLPTCLIRLLNAFFSSYYHTQRVWGSSSKRAI